jgi:aspartyl-tRNA(Asn)/glutamyl-tRNA(Gln) amidotransferase subunit A
MPDESLRELADQIGTGQLSPIAVMESTLRRIEATEPLVHAFTAVDAERAMARAGRSALAVRRGEPRGPLHGVPFAVKDMIDIQGLVTGCGSRVPVYGVGQVAPGDAAIVRQLRRAGAIPVGKLAMEEFGIGSDDDDRDGPAARNPWDTRCTPGGSSTGCGAAAAAGLVPLAIGTDTGGSIRCPAALCGVAGLKPGYAKISRTGVFPLAPTLDHLGMITRTVADCALVFGALTGTMAAAGPARRGPPLDGLTIGVIRHFFTTDCPATAELITAIDAAVGVLAGLGSQIADIQIKPAHAYRACGSTIQCFEAYAIHRPWLRSHARDYRPATRAALSAGAAITGEAYRQAMLTRRRLQQDFTARMRASSTQVLVTAATLGPAWRAGDHQARASTGDYAPRIAFNVLGVPALAIPIGFSGAGLPLSMQLIAQAGHEKEILRTGIAYEQATDWHRIGPALAAPRSA